MEETKKNPRSVASEEEKKKACQSIGVRDMMDFFRFVEGANYDEERTLNYTTGFLKYYATEEKILRHEKAVDKVIARVESSMQDIGCDTDSPKFEAFMATFIDAFFEVVNVWA